MTAPREQSEICGIGTFLVCSFPQRSRFPHGSVHSHHVLLQSIRGPSAAAPARSPPGCKDSSRSTCPESPEKGAQTLCHQGSLGLVPVRAGATGAQLLTARFVNLMEQIHKKGKNSGCCFAALPAPCRHSDHQLRRGAGLGQQLAHRNKNTVGHGI